MIKYHNCKSQHHLYWYTNNYIYTILKNPLKNGVTTLINVQPTEKCLTSINMKLQLIIKWTLLPFDCSSLLKPNFTILPTWNDSEASCKFGRRGEKDI